MNGFKMSRKQRRAINAVRKTLEDMDHHAFWTRVMKKHIKNVEANERMRRKSWAHAGSSTILY